MTRWILLEKRKTKTNITEIKRSLWTKTVKEWKRKNTNLTHKKKETSSALGGRTSPDSQVALVVNSSDKIRYTGIIQVTSSRGKLNDLCLRTIANI